METSPPCLAAAVPRAAVCSAVQGLFRWQVRGSLGLFLKFSGFLTVARENVDKRGAHTRKGTSDLSSVSHSTIIYWF